MSTPTLFQKEKVVVVTGGRRGLGKAMALAFAEAGANVAVCDMVTNDGELEAVAKEISSLGSNALALQVDVTNKTDVDHLINEVINKFGQVDVLINNAGISGGPDLSRLTEEEIARLRETRTATRMGVLNGSDDIFDRVMATHLKGSLFCAQSAAKNMVERKTGCIINLSSMQAFAKNSSAYNIAKAAIIAFTKGLAWELGPYNIRVNAMAPGIIRTDMTQHVWGNPTVMQDVINKTPLGRLGEPYDVACAALLLASDAARFITGQTILVDGGLVPLG